LDEPTFHYQITCSARDCDRPPRYKIAAHWSYGPLRELKNYGLACEGHRDDLLVRARSRREILSVGDDEAVGPVAAFPFVLDPPTDSST